MTAPSNPTDCGRPDLLAEARAAHQRGWSLTPLKGKVPMKKGWQKAPSSTETDLECWASQGNLGLRTGPASGVVVIDDDTEDGSGAAGLGLPTTVTVETGSGKRHYYFKQPEQELGNSTGSLPEHVDVRGDGGQVVFVGSLHPDTGQPYRWVPGLSPDEVELAALPQNVIDLINTPKKAKTKPKPKAPKRQKKRRPVALDQNAEQALADAASAVSTATEGTRNKVLNAEAFRVGRWVNTGLLSRAEVETALVGAATSVGLSEGEAASTVRSGLRAGEASPSRQKGASDPKGARAVKPAIIVEGGALPEIVTKAEQALLKSGVQIFQRGSVLVQAIRAPAMTIRDVYRRTEGVLMISEVEPPHLVEVFTSVANWFTESRGHLVLIDCPERVARTYVARTGKWRLRYLLGVIEAPTLRPDGSILATPGYDSKTCLLFDPGSEKFPEISEAPTREDALAALDQILTVIAEFEFLEESDRSAVVAAILTALIRPSLRSAPMFAFRAPKMASGKSLLGDVVAMIATGRTASVMTQGKDEDEDKKRLLAVLMEGISVACIDNIEHDFGGAAMCSVLTQETWRDRILGKTGTATVPTNTTWIATGNNIRFVGDITTRVVLCDLDPTVERPEERVYQVNLHKYVPEHRAELVVAGLTVLRAFHVAGLPSQGLRVFGRFEEWSDRVRSALVWLGLADPCLGRARIHEYDPVGRQLKAFLVGWYGAANDAPTTAGDFINRATPVVNPSKSAVYNALAAVCGGPGGKPDARRLGHYLSKYERRQEGGLRAERVGERQGVALWRVVRVGPPPSGGTSAPAPVGCEGQEGYFRSVPGTSETCSGGAVDMPGGDECESNSRSPEEDPRNPPLGGEPEDPGTDENTARRDLAENNPPDPRNPPGPRAGDADNTSHPDPAKKVPRDPRNPREEDVPQPAELDPVFEGVEVPVLRAREDGTFETDDGHVVQFTELTYYGNGQWLTTANQKVRVVDLEDAAGV